MIFNLFPSSSSNVSTLSIIVPLLWDIHVLDEWMNKWESSPPIYTILVNFWKILLLLGPTSFQGATRGCLPLHSYFFIYKVGTYLIFNIFTSNNLFPFPSAWIYLLLIILRCPPLTVKWSHCVVYSYSFGFLSSTSRKVGCK